MELGLGLFDNGVRVAFSRCYVTEKGQTSTPLVYVEHVGGVVRQYNVEVTVTVHERAVAPR